MAIGHKENRLIYASDTTAWDHCPRHAWFLLHPPDTTEIEPDRFETLIQTMGDAHEANVLAGFERPVRAESVSHTEQLIKQNTPVIYQPQFIDRRLGLFGVPDFLLLSDQGYQVADVKLALSVDHNRSIKTQMAVYRRLSGTIVPARVYLGNGEITELPDDDAELAETYIHEMQALVQLNEMPETHYSYSKCISCPFSDICIPLFKRHDALTLSPAIDARVGKQLVLQGHLTLSDIAKLDSDDISDAPYLKGRARKERIIRQAVSIKTGKVFAEQPLVLPTGTLVHFDVESDPLTVGGEGEVYLWGLLRPPYGEGEFDPIWREQDDYQTWRAFLRLIEAYRNEYSDLVLVHYSPYERVQIRHYAERYEETTDPTVQWVLDAEGPLWDLQKFIKQHLVLPVSSYGLKSICRASNLVNFQWRLQESGSQWSVVRYYDYLEAEGPQEAQAIKQEILTYNEDDVRATAAMVDWIKQL